MMCLKKDICYSILYATIQKERYIYKKKYYNYTVFVPYKWELVRLGGLC